MKKKKQPMKKKKLACNFTSSVRKSCLGLKNNELLMCFSNQSISMKFTVFGDHLIIKAAVYQKFTEDIIFCLIFELDLLSPLPFNSFKSKAVETRQEQCLSHLFQLHWTNRHRSQSQLSLHATLF